MRWQNDKPIPVPDPTSLVVKNGSKMRGRISLGMPGPVSATRTTMLPLSGDAASTRHLPLAFPAMQRLLGVDQQIDQHLAELVGIGPDRRKVRLHVDRQLDVGRSNGIAGHLDGGGDDFVDRDVRDLCRLLPGHREEGLDDPGAAFRGLADLVGALPRPLRRRRSPSVISDRPSTTDSGLFSSCATPASKPPSADSFSFWCSVSR